MAKHAILSPSSASRWLECTPSARLESKIQEESSIYADEGTLAHALGELMILYRLGRISKKEYNQKLKVIEASPLYNSEMFDHCKNYTDYVLEAYNEMIDSGDIEAEIHTETVIDLSKYAPESFGTVDIQIIGNYIHVIDLKYGKGVLVEADDNKQLYLYGLGVLEKYEHTEFSKILLTIYQPRIDNIDTIELLPSVLISWAESYLKPRAKLAYHGKGERVAGSHCKFCKIKTSCKAHHDYQAEVIADFPNDPMKINDELISKIILRANDFKNWLTAVEVYALERALKDNKKWPGLKIVESKSSRKYVDENKIAEILTDEFYTDDVIFEKSLLGITKLQKLLGQNQFHELIEPLLVKPKGSPILVSEKDKRLEFNNFLRAARDFAEFKDDD